MAWEKIELEGIGSRWEGSHREFGARQNKDLRSRSQSGGIVGVDKELRYQGMRDRVARGGE